MRVSEVIVVEGRYDKNTVLQAVDATVVETEGFGVFSDGEKLALIRRLAEKRGIIILTDSDSAGFLIRNKLKGSLDPKTVKMAYIPDVYGREKRKRAPSKEGKLGVEGMERSVIIEALLRAGATVDGNVSGKPSSSGLTKADLYGLGFSGTGNAAENRRKLLRRLGLPERLSANAFLDVLNALYPPEELTALLQDGGADKA